MIKKALWQRLAVIGIGIFLLALTIVLRNTFVGSVGLIVLITGMVSALKWMWQHDGEGK